jgi:arylsulfatase A-like enzyme
MNQRMLIYQITFVLMTGLLWGAPPPASEKPALPNIVFIVSDDQGWRDIGYRHSAISTPNLDRLASGGIRLEHHYVFPTCSPTRCAILCGRNPARFGILGPIAGKSTLKMPADIPNLASMLKSRGYFTAISGKWHLSLQIENGPRKYGFDSSYGYLHGQIDPWSHEYKAGDRTWHRNDEFTEDKGHATDLIAAEAVRVIEQKRQQPLFLYVAFSVPHTPLAEEARWTAPYEKRFPEETRRLVGASISHLDEAVGRIIGAVDKAGLRENTLIIFTSDNGGPQRVTPSDEYEGRYKHMNGPHSDNGPLHGWKGEVYEGGILAPSLVNWPARLKPRVENTVMSAMDWLPTLAALSGFQIKEEMKLEGVNIWPILSGASRGQFRTLYWKTSDQSAVRLGDWKLVSGKKSGMELFDLSRDPYEKTNLAEREAGRLAELKAALTHEAAK